MPGLIRFYDPDFIAGHVPFPEGGGRVDEAARQGGDGSGTRDPVLPWHLQSRMIYTDAWEDVARLAGEWSSPIKAFIRTPASFSAHEIIDMEWHADSYQYLTVMPPLADEPPLITLDLDAVDPVVALMVEIPHGSPACPRSGRWPCADPRRRRGSEAAGAVGHHRRDPACWLGPRAALPGSSRRHASGGQSALAAGEFMQRTPFARTREWLALGRTAAGCPAPGGLRHRRIGSRPRPSGRV